MKTIPLVEKLPVPLRRRPLLVAVAGAALLALLYLWLRPAKVNGVATAYHEVKRGEFAVTVIEGGTLAAVNEVSIRSEVEGTARIVSIVPEGSYVKKGDLLVELDSAQAQDQVNQQLINVEKARFAVTNAEATLEIQRSATNSDFLSADLKLKFAKIDREKYLQGQRLVDLVEASNKVVQAEAQLAVNLDSFSNSVNLAARGYEMKVNVDRDRMAVLANRNSLIVASNGIHMLARFDVPKLLAKYDSDVLQAEQELERVVSQNKRKMGQYEADLRSQINTLELNESKLARDEKNLKNTKIYAPQDGLVVYQVSESRFSSESLIEGGAVVRNRQELIKLPDLSRMKVTIKVHESHVTMIQPGLPAFVTLDSMPDVRFRGVVERVAPLPDTQARWGNPNLKVYNTDIHLTETVPNVKPGVSAKAEVIITSVADTLSVPIQAVTSVKGKQAVYLVNSGKPEPRPVEVGLFNTKFIEITKGLKEGDRVLLSPPIDMQGKDLEGGVLADNEKAKFATTNARPRAASSGQPGGGQLGAGRPALPGASPEAQEGQPGAGRRRGLSQEEMVKQFDKNGDGQLDESEREAMRTAMAARFGGTGGPGGPRMSREDMLKQFDKNGDGEIDESEREAMRTAIAGRFGGPGGPGGQRLSREEMLKRFDKNGDGELDETERAAMREALSASRTNRTDRPQGGESEPAAGPRGNRAAPSGGRQGADGGGKAPQ